MIVVVLTCVMLACVFVAAVCLGRARSAGEVDRFKAACAELERELGAALRPATERMVADVVRWHDRVKSGRT